MLDTESTLSTLVGSGNEFPEPAQQSQLLENGRLPPRLNSGCETAVFPRTPHTISTDGKRPFARRVMLVLTATRIRLITRRPLLFPSSFAYIPAGSPCGLLSHRQYGDDAYPSHLLHWRRRNIGLPRSTL